MDRHPPPSATARAVTFTVCFHGAESTGKSVLADQLSRELGLPWVPEYGRSYAETHGTSFAMSDLVAIAEGQAEATWAALVERPPLLILDTDQLMTAAWSAMLFGTVPDKLLSYPRADLYLHFAADVPWIDDGTRFFGTDARRERFAAIAEEMLGRAGVCWLPVAGCWDVRAEMVRNILRDCPLEPHPEGWSAALNG